MKRLLTSICVALALTGCAVPSLTVGAGQAPAPLAATTFDDSALSAAWKSFDVALDGINLAMDACRTSSLSVCGRIKPGSASAVRIANAIDSVTGFLTAAENAAAAASTTDYKLALVNARSALTELRAALKG